VATTGSSDIPEVTTLRQGRSYEKSGRLSENGIAEFRRTVRQSTENFRKISGKILSRSGIKEGHTVLKGNNCRMCEVIRVKTEIFGKKVFLERFEKLSLPSMADDEKERVTCAAEAIIIFRGPEL
jgi:hypothetical protein